MVTRIYARGFKGLDFDQPLGRRTLIMGRVGSGKSARALALVLLSTGALPGTGIAKNNGDILNAVGSGDTLTVGLEVDGKTLERSYKRKKGGTVGCDYRIDGEPTPKNLFELEFSRLGIRIADVPTFLSLSDAKQVDEIFCLFPPAGDLKKINIGISAAKAEVSRLDAIIKGKEQSIQNLSTSIASLDMPAGSLPEVQAEIVKVERESQEARDALTREKMRLEQAAHTAQEAEEAAKAVAQPKPATPIGLPLERAVPQHTPAPTAGRVPDTGVAVLERVLAALEKAGCSACAAKMVLKRELKLLREVAHA